MLVRGSDAETSLIEHHAAKSEIIVERRNQTAAAGFSRGLADPRAMRVVVEHFECAGVLD